MPGVSAMLYEASLSLFLLPVRDLLYRVLNRPDVGGRIVFSAGLLVALAVSTCAELRSAGLPRFEDYSVGHAFTGSLTSPRLPTPLEQRYAAQIRDGVEKGYGVFRDGKEQKGPNFAGRMIVVQWSCGSPCLRMAMVDAITGIVYYPPISYDGIRTQNFDLPLLIIGNSVPQNPEVRFRLNSGLMIIQATQTHSRNNHSYTYYFLWRQNKWTLLRKATLNEPIQ